MTIQSSIKDKIFAAQNEASEAVNAPAEMLGGLDDQMEYMLKECVMDFGGSWDIYLPLVEFSYNNSYHSSMRCASFEALYGRKCCSPILCAEVGEGQLIGPEIV
nr:putative reverse transcriptase domain-containing protein [Tanacetum cinerariifolium]